MMETTLKITKKKLAVAALGMADLARVTEQREILKKSLGILSLP